MIILVDSREQNNTHVLKYFDDNKIRYEKRALKTGDYNFMIEACSELGFQRDTYFTDELVIERKNSVQEIAGNFCEKDGRFFRELSRMAETPNNYIIIEEDRFDDIINGNYRSKLNSLSLVRTMLTMQKRSNFHLMFINKESMGIYHI